MKHRKLAKLPVRVIAYIIDFSIVSLMNRVLFPLIEGIPYLSFLMMLPGAIYFVKTISSSRQATFGQHMMNIHVVRTDGNPMDFGLALDRYLSQVLFFVLFALCNILFMDLLGLVPVWIICMMLLNIAFITWYVVAIFDRENCTVHDMLFRTRVIEGRLSR